MASDDGSDSCFLSLYLNVAEVPRLREFGYTYEWDIKPIAPQWVWATPRGEQLGIRGILLFYLSAGTHTLQVKNREDGTKFDVFVLQRVEQDVAALIECLKNKDARIRQEAIRTLAILKAQEVIEPLRAALNNTVESISGQGIPAYEAVLALEALGDVDGLFLALKHRNASVRKEAIRALERLSSAEGVTSPVVRGLNPRTTGGLDVRGLNLRTTLAKSLCNLLMDADSGVQMEAICALESLGSSERAQSRSDSVAPLAGFIATTEEEDVVREASLALGGIGQPLPVDVISPLLSHAKTEVVRDAIAALGKLRKPDVAEQLVEFLYHKSDSIRFEAAIALGRCGSTTAVEDLRSLLGDANEQVRLAAADALYCLGEAEGLGMLRATGALLGTDWYFLGPFDGLNGEGINKAYPPEKTIDIEATYQGKTAPIRWKRLDGIKMGMYIDPSIFMPSDGNVVLYAFTAVDVPDARRADLRVRSSDNMKVWLNGKLVSAHPLMQGKQIPITLREGCNTILLKLLQRKGLWYFQAQLTDEFGKAFEDITYSAPVPKSGTSATQETEFVQKARFLIPNLPVLETTGYELESYASGFPTLHETADDELAGLPTLTALAAGPDGLLYAISRSGGLRPASKIYRIAPDTSWREFAEVSQPTDITCDAEGNVYVTSGIGGEAAVFKYTPTGARTTVAKGFTVPSALRRAPDGTLFIADSFTGTIVKVAADGTSSTFPEPGEGAKRLFIDGLAKPSGATCLAFAPDGMLWFIERKTGKLFRVNAAGFALASTELQGYEIHRICFDADGNLYATAPKSGLVLQRDSTGQVKLLARGFATKGAENSGPLGLTIDAKGNLYITHQRQVLKMSRL